MNWVGRALYFISRPRREGRGCLCMLLLMALLAVVGCSAAPRAGDPVSGPIESISEARLSPDGALIAVEGIAEPPRLDNPRDLGVWFVDLDKGSVVYSTPAGWFCLLPSWGPGTSYVQKRRSPDATWGIYWSQSGSTPTTVLIHDSGGQRTARLTFEAHLDPGLKWVVAGHRTPDRSATRVTAFPLQDDRPPLALWEEPGYRPLLGVVADPVDTEQSLVLVATTPVPQGAPGIAVAAVALPGGDTRWRERLPDPGSSSALFGPASSYSREQVLVGAVVTDSLEPREEHSRLWLIDLATGHTRLFGSIPSSFEWITVIGGEGPGRSVFAGGSHDVWMVGDAAGAEESRMIVAGGKDARGAGVREEPGGGLGVYMRTRHCLWRCRLRDDTVECILGTPRDHDDPPRIVGRP